MKKFFALLLIICFAVTGVVFWQVANNNRNVTPASHALIEQHFIKAVAWLESNYTDVENVQNPVLWWMIKQAAEVSDNEVLKNIYSNYKKTHLDSNPPNLSTPMFDRFYRPRMPDISLLSGLQDYQLFFFYALSCNEDLGSEVVIQNQMQPGFCTLHYLHPRCITHQLMGLRFMQRHQCGYDDLVQETINELQNDVISELTWDFRVADAYIQRVLMLADTGAYSRIKPVWIHNILAAQNSDGSWDDLHPIITLDNDTVLAFTSTLPAVRKIQADFHATAQGIWLLSLLLDETAAKAVDL